MATDGLTGLTLVAFSLLAAVWLSIAFGAARPSVEAPVEDVHAQHVSMIERMRRDVSPQMVREMNEPRWREMRQPGMIAEMEAHLQQADRLRGRP